MSHKVVVVTGASGRIAYSLIPLLCQGDAFGKHIRLSLRLLDIEACMGKLQGAAMEIQDCAYDLVDDVVATIDPEVAFRDADVAILLGGFPRLAGMERRDLIEKNSAIMKAQAVAIDMFAKKSVHVLVVANPCNTNCFVAQRVAKSIPAENFSCLTQLDHHRLLGMVTKKLNEVVPDSCRPVLPHHVRHLAVFGNHSPTMVANIERAEVLLNGEYRSVTEFLDEHWRWEVLPGMLQGRGGEVIRSLGVSSAMSAAHGIVNHLQHWVMGGDATSASFGTIRSPPVYHPVFSMGVRSDLPAVAGAYNVPPGLIFSYPFTHDNHGNIMLVRDLPISPVHETMLQKTITELQGELADVRALMPDIFE